MNQIDTRNAAESLNLLGKVLFWLAGVVLFVAVLTLLSKDKFIWLLFLVPGVLVWLVGCFFRGMAAIIFNQVKNNELLEALLKK